MAASPEPDYDAEMRLPEGKRCDDCIHAKRCFGMGFSQSGRTSCDFWPNRFHAVAPAAPDPNEWLLADYQKTVANLDSYGEEE